MKDTQIETKSTFFHFLQVVLENKMTEFWYFLLCILKKSDEILALESEYVLGELLPYFKKDVRANVEKELLEFRSRVNQWKLGAGY